MPRCRPALALVLAVAALAGCSDFPGVDAALGPEAARASYPQLLPLEDILEAARFTGPTGPEITAPLQDRAARLRARADALRRQVIDAETRTRMEDAVSSAVSG